VTEIIVYFYIIYIRYEDDVLERAVVTVNMSERMVDASCRRRPHLLVHIRCIYALNATEHENQAYIIREKRFCVMS
jgi:hypothetical protein